MIINCDYCKNNKECEYKDNYNRLQSRAVEFFRNADKDPLTHSYFTWNISCDYFYPEQKTNPCCKDGRECDNAL